MSFEGPNKRTPQAEYPLKHWFGENFSTEEQAIIEADMFNDTDNISLETVFNKITDQETARQVMAKLREYLEAKKSGASSESLKGIELAIHEFLDKKAFPEYR